MPAFEGIEGLKENIKKLLLQNISSEEKTLFCIVGHSDQSLIALSERVIIIKTGMMAGVAFGSRVTTFLYKDITGIEINTGWMSGVIEICTPSYSGTAEKDYWNQSRNSDPFIVSNCIPIDKNELNEFNPYLDKLRTFVQDAKKPVNSPVVMVDKSSFISELQKLADMKQSGILTDEEFQQAKKKLLS